MGAGILYVNSDNKLSDFKEMDSFDNFYKAYHYLRGKTKKPMILHFRIATHGAINKDNTHPFFVNDNLGFVHNGIIDIDTCKNYSDTYYFNELLKDLPKDFLTNQSILTLLELSISWSKLIFMNDKGETTIINEISGEWVGSDWFSNTTYKKSEYIDFGGKKVKKSYFSEDVEEKGIKPSKDDFYNDSEAWSKYYEGLLNDELESDTYLDNDTYLAREFDRSVKNDFKTKLIN